MARFSDCPGVLVTESGAWVPVVDRGEISSAISPLTGEFVSALGKRTAFFRGHAPREWSVSGSATWAQAQAIARLASAKAQKFYWVSPLGRHTNVLPSDVPLYGSPVGIQVAGGVPVDAYSPNDLGNNVSAAFPVYPGLEITGSAYIAGGLFRIWWRDAERKITGTVGIQGKSELSEVQMTATAPATAVEAMVMGQGVRMFGAPAIRIGHDATKFETGPAESRWVTLHDVQISHGNIAYKHSPFQVSFTLKEVS